MSCALASALEQEKGPTAKKKMQYICIWHSIRGTIGLYSQLIILNDPAKYVP